MTHNEIKELLLKLQAHMMMKAPLAIADEALLAKLTSASSFSTLYRGIGTNGSIESPVHVTSWTLNKSVAEDFSRFHNSCEKRSNGKVIKKEDLKGYYLPLVLNQLWENIVDEDFKGDANELVPIIDLLFSLERNEDEVIVFPKNERI